MMENMEDGPLLSAPSAAERPKSSTRKEEKA